MNSRPMTQGRNDVRYDILYDFLSGWRIANVPGLVFLEPTSLKSNSWVQFKQKDKETTAAGSGPPHIEPKTKDDI